MTTREAETKDFPVYPSSALQRCPETLQPINISEPEWEGMEPKEQVQALFEGARRWAEQYFECAIRHNVGAEVYEAQLCRINEECEEAE